MTELQALFFLEKQFQVRELQTDDGGIFSENEHSEPAASRTDSGFFFFFFFFATRHGLWDLGSLTRN